MPPNIILPEDHEIINSEVPLNFTLTTRRPGIEQAESPSVITLVAKLKGARTQMV